MKILPYFCDEATNPGKQWLAHLDLGKDIYMSFFGANKDEAIERAERWYAGERAKHREVGNTPVNVVASSVAAQELAPKPVDDGWRTTDMPAIKTFAVDQWADVSSYDFKVSDHKLSGSVWVLNRATGHRARIAANELASYEEKGYIKGGPRSK